MPVHVDIYEPDGTTFVRRLTQTWGRTWSVEMHEDGAGQLMTQVGTDDAAVLTHRRMVKVVDDPTETVLAAWVIRGDRSRHLDAAGEHSQTLAVSGVGVRSRLAEMLVYPTLGVGRMAGPDRPLTWAGGSLDRSVGWIAATELKAVRDTEPPYAGAPAAFPLDPDQEWSEPYWIQARPSVPGDSETPPQRVGDEYAYRAFYVPTQTDAGVFWAADDGLEIWIDDRRWAQETQAFMWMQTKEFGLVLDAGWHHIAVKLTNIERDSVATNGSAFCLAIHRMLDGGGEIGEPILVTDDEWIVVEEPVPAPTMTPGEILELLLSEAQDRGCWPALTWGFTASLDSYGESWETPVDITATVNRPVSMVLEELEEVSVDTWIDPEAAELVVVNKGTLGVDRSSTVMLLPSANVAGEDITGEALIANAALVQHGSGVFVEVAHGSSVAVYGRVEGGASIGSADSADQVERVMGEWFAEHAVSEWDLAVEVEAVSGSVPLVDFGVGDLVTMPTASGPQVVRVQRVDVAEVDPSSDGRRGGSQRFVVHGSVREVLA